MRPVSLGLFGAVLIAAPLSAGAGEGLSVPPAGVLTPSNTIASLYDGRGLVNGQAPVPAIEAPKQQRAASAPAARKPERVRAALRPAMRPSTRKIQRPPASLPRAAVPPVAAHDMQTRAQMSPQNSAQMSAAIKPYPSQIQAAPSPSAPVYGQAPAPSGSSISFSDLFMPGSRAADGTRGLFTRSPAAPNAATPIHGAPAPSPAFTAPMQRSSIY